MSEVCGNCGLDNIEHGVEVCLHQLDNTVQHLRQKLAASELENDDVRKLSQARYIVTIGWSFDGTKRTVSLWGKGCPDSPFEADTVREATAAAAAWLEKEGG